MYSTHQIFTGLINKVNVKNIFDIGCLDCKDSIIFHQLFSDIQISAFEANPVNYDKIIKNGIDKYERISLFNLGVASKMENKKLYSYLEKSTKRNGISSTKKRLNNEVVDEFEVEFTTIDNFTRTNNLFGGIALWIDVEGAGLEVLQGMGSNTSNVKIIHIEVESGLKDIYKEQHSKQEINNYLSKKGFIEIAFSPHKGGIVGDSVYLNTNCLSFSVRFLIVYLKFKSNLSAFLRSNLKLLKNKEV